MALGRVHLCAVGIFTTVGVVEGQQQRLFSSKFDAGFLKATDKKDKKKHASGIPRKVRIENEPNGMVPGFSLHRRYMCTTFRV